MTSWGKFVKIHFTYKLNFVFNSHQNSCLIYINSKPFGPSRWSLPSPSNKVRNKQIGNLDFSVLSGSSTFEIGHFEVWGLGPQPWAEEEWAKVEVRKPDLDIEDGGNVDMIGLTGQIC